MIPAANSETHDVAHVSSVALPPPLFGTHQSLTPPPPSPAAKQPILAARASVARHDTR